MATLAEQWMKQGLEEGLRKGFKQGFEQGFEQGFKQGFKQGLERGLDQGRRQTLARQLELKFGPVPDSVQAHLAAASSDEITRWTERVLTAECLNDVFVVERP